MNTVDARRLQHQRWTWLPAAIVFAVLAAGTYSYAAHAADALAAILGR